MGWGERTRSISCVVLLGVACALAGCVDAKAAAPTPSPVSTPEEPEPVAWENHTTSLSCEGAVQTDEYGYYGWSYDPRANEWVKDDDPTVESALSSLAPLTPQQEIDLDC